MSNLIQLKSNLTSLKFNPESAQPYIQTGIPGYTATRQQDRQYSIISNSKDTLIRGGAQGSAILRSIDKERIQKFIADPSRGPQFLQRQTTLQLMNPKIETGIKPGINPTTLLPTIIENTRLYNVDNTIEQIGLSGTGAHIVRSGDSPYNPIGIYYGATVGAQNIFNQSATNRLVLLTNMKMKTDGGFINNTINTITNAISTITGQNGTNILDRAAPLIDFALAKKMGISLNRNLMFNYPAGPGSRIGGKDTIIPRYEDTTTIRNSRTMVYEQLRQRASQKESLDTPVTPENINDFRGLLSGYNVLSPTSVAWSNNKTLENRLKFGQQGKVDPSLPQGKPTSYAVTVSTDEINALLPVITNEQTSPYENNKDIIKFGFECISNDDPTQSVALIFRAMLTAGLSDNHSATWNSFKYIGRGENFYTYQGFDRAVSFSFRIAALSRNELKPLYNKLNYLASQVYPDYSPTSNIMRAPIVKLTIGDYFNRTPGILQSVNITVDNNYPWEINLEEDTTDTVQQLPQVLDVAVTFTPILSVLPQRSIGQLAQIPGSVATTPVNKTTSLLSQAPFINNNTAQS